MTFEGTVTEDFREDAAAGSTRITNGTVSTWPACWNCDHILYRPEEGKFVTMWTSLGGGPTASCVCTRLIVVARSIGCACAKLRNPSPITITCAHASRYGSKALVELPSCSVIGISSPARSGFDGASFTVIEPIVCVKEVDAMSF